MKVRVKRYSNDWHIEYKNWWNIKWKTYKIYVDKDAAVRYANILKDPIIINI